jgi:hypothetical protein
MPPRLAVSLFLLFVFDYRRQSRAGDFKVRARFAHPKTIKNHFLGTPAPLRARNLSWCQGADNGTFANDLELKRYS